MINLFEDVPPPGRRQIKHEQQSTTVKSDPDMPGLLRADGSPVKTGRDTPPRQFDPSSIPAHPQQQASASSSSDVSSRSDEQQKQDLERLRALLPSGNWFSRFRSRGLRGKTGATARSGSAEDQLADDLSRMGFPTDTPLDKGKRLLARAQAINLGAIRTVKQLDAFNLNTWNPLANEYLAFKARYPTLVAGKLKPLADTMSVLSKRVKEQYKAMTR